MRATASDADPLLAGNLMHYLMVLVLGSQFIDEGNRTPVCLCKGVVAQRARAHVREGEVFIPEGTRAHIQGLCSWWHASERLNARPSGDHNQFNATSCLSGCPTRMVWCAIEDPWGLGAMPRPCIGRKLAINKQSVNVHFSWERRRWPSKCVA